MSHISVLLPECMEALLPSRGGLFIDATAGGGGHSEAILKGGAGGLLAIDKDGDAIERCSIRLAGYPVEFLRTDYKDLDAVREALGGRKVQGGIRSLGKLQFELHLQRHKL